MLCELLSPSDSLKPGPVIGGQILEFLHPGLGRGRGGGGEHAVLLRPAGGVEDGEGVGGLPLGLHVGRPLPADELKDLIEKIWDWWIEEGKNRERLGELMKRQSFQKLLEVTGVEAQPYHVTSPRANPYIFFKEEEVPGGFTRDLKDYRSRHQR